MADEVTPTIEKTPDEIEREMFETRESLTEKVHALENQVVGTAQTAADTFSNTVETIRSLVTQAPQSVKECIEEAAATMSETLRQTFDVSGHVRRHPWTAVGVAAMLGCAVGWVVSRRPARSSPKGRIPTEESPLSAESKTLAEAIAGEEHEANVLDDLKDMVGEKVKELARTTLDTVAATLKEGIKTGLPRLVEETTARLKETQHQSDLSTAASTAASKPSDWRSRGTAPVGTGAS